MAFVSPSTVYRILKGANLVCPWRRRPKRSRTDEEKASRPDEIWATDFMYLSARRSDVFFGDLPGRILAADRASCLGAEHGRGHGERRGPVGDRAIPPREGGEIPRRHASRADRQRELLHLAGVPRVLDEHQLGHQRIKPHCPEENGIIERSNRTLREALDGEELTTCCQAREMIGRIIRWYNSERLHSALGYLQTDRLLPGRPGAAARAAAPKDGRGASSAAREESSSCGSPRCL